LGKWPQLPHPPDTVKRPIDGENQSQCSHDEGDQTHCAKPRCFGCKLRQIAEYVTRNTLGHQALHQPRLQGALHLGKHGEGREHRKHQREKWHQGDHGCERQARSGQAKAVFTKALAQHGSGVAPGEVRQDLQPLSPRLRWKLRFIRHDAMMPAFASAQTAAPEVVQGFHCS
jgi:hypothetical protein